MDQDRLGTTGTGTTGSFGGGTSSIMDEEFGGGDSSRTSEARTRVKEAAMTAKEKAAEKIEEEFDSQKGRATHQLSDLSRSLRMASENMPSDGGVGRYMSLAATQVDNLASFLDNADVADLMDDVEAFARRQPAAFLGGAFALGVLGARFLKSSRRNARDDRFDAYGAYDGSGFGDTGFSNTGGYPSSGGTGTRGQGDDFR